ncbi:MAG: lyase [Alphaproteobacteria bacterium]|nr:lyase [Alphaproteobacteria bacterium]
MLRSLLLSLAVALPVAAQAQVEIREYPLPPKLYAHDVWADPAPDGPVYIAFQRSGHLGVLDPKTGKVDTIALGQDSAPHGVIQDKAGDLWLTDGGQNAIVRVNGKSREVTKWHLPPQRGYVNLNTAAFDAAGVHWFTGQNGIVGRLDPRSGEMKVFDAPKGRGPYGIQATPDGVVYFTSLAGSYIARIDPADAITVIEPPTSGQGARRVWSDSKGILWVSEFNSGQLSRFDPKTGAWKAWKAPGDRPRVYAVYVDEQDRPWVSEWTAQVMLRFDPRTETFETFKSSSGTANVRQIHGRKGEVWTPESAADKIVLYRFK